MGCNRAQSSPTPSTTAPPAGAARVKWRAISSNSPMRGRRGGITIVAAVGPRARWQQETQRCRAQAPAHGHADELAVAGADGLRPQRQAEGQVEAHREVQRPHHQHTGHGPPEGGLAQHVEPECEAGGRELAGREGDVAHVQPQAEELREHRHQAQHEAQRDVGRQARDVGSREHGPARGAFAAQRAREARVVRDGRVELVEDEPVLEPARDDAAGEQQHTGEGGEERRGPQQVQAVQHMLRLLGADHGLAREEQQRRADQQHRGHHHAHVAQDGRDLRAEQVRDLVDEAAHRAGGLDVAQLGHHGRCGHGGLLGRHRPLQQHDEHEAGSVVEAGREAAPEGREPQAIERELDPGGEAEHEAAACGLAEHFLVLGRVAGDVVLAALGAALGHLGGGEVRAGGDERAHAAVFDADLDQVGQQRGVGAARLIGQQAVQQLLDAHDALAQLAQAEHDAHRHAVFLEVVVDRVGGVSAGVELLAQAVGGLVSFGAARAVHAHLAPQRLEHAGQLVKGAFGLRLGRHADADLGGEAGGADLAGAEGQRVHQRLVPHLRAALGGEHGQAPQRGGVQRLDPAHVEGRGEQQREQLGEVARLGRAGQQLAAQAVAQLAQEGGARCEAEVGQQGGDVHARHEGAQPGVPALAQGGVVLERADEQAHARDRGGHVERVAAHPGQGVGEPQVALRQRRLGRHRVEELLQVHAGPGDAAQCSTREDGASLAPLPPARRANSGTAASKRSPSSATQKKLPRMAPVGVRRRVPLVYWKDSPGRSSG